MDQVWRRAAWMAALGLAVAGGRAEAAGYALREQSATALGNAFAGATAGAEDITYFFFNPAALTRVEGYAAGGALSWVAPRSELEDASGTTAAGTPAGGDRDDDDIAENALLPALYLAAPLGERVRLGLALATPFGLMTEYPDDWVGRYHAIDSELWTVNLSPTVAVKVTDWLSLGAGVQAQYAKGRLTNAVDYGSIAAGLGVPGAVPGAQDGEAKLEGDDWGYGYELGLLAEPVKGTRLGIAYRSKIEHTLDGQAHFRNDSAGVGAGLQALGGGIFSDTDARLDLTTPATLSFGIHQDIGERFAVMAEAAWTDWSQFDELKVEFDNPAQPDSVTEEEWQDSWFFAVGATWKPRDTLTLRAGVAYDQSPVKDRYRTPRIPDEDRYWLAFGLSWQPRPWLGLDAGYTHILVEDSDVDLSDPVRGDLSARYDNSIDVATVGLRFSF